MAKTIAEMTLEQQIKRLVRQRNALWKMVDEFVGEFAPDGAGLHKEWMCQGDDQLGDVGDISIARDGTIVVTIPDLGKRLREVRLAAGKLYHRAQTIVGNPYAVEGYNPRTGERESDDDEDMPKGFELYIQAAGDPW